MNEAKESAQAIYQRLLDEIGLAIVERDRRKYASFFSLPHKLETFERSISITTAAQLDVFFDRLVAKMANLGASELTRYCTVAEYVDDTTIRGHHETKLVNQALVIVEDYIALSTLELKNGVWLVSASQYAEPKPSLPTQITN